MITKEITQLVEKALQKLSLEGEVLLEHPADLSHGDFSCNVAMVLAKEIGEAPRQLAERVVAGLPDSEHIARVEVAGPGFINFFLSREFFTDQTKRILEQGEKWGTNDKNKGQTILLEHSSPNLFKPFHIGHLVNNALGESLVRILNATGATIVPLSFPSDVSPGIAKTVWAIIEKEWEDELTMEKIGDAYVYGVANYETHKEEIDAINKAIYTQEKGTAVWRVYEKGMSMSLAYFLSIAKKLGSEFDELIFESEAEKEGKKIVQDNTPKVFEESDGAIIFRGSEYGLFDNVFINSAGFGTYLAKDIGLISLKFSKYDFNMSVTVTDTEQKNHFEMVKKSAELIQKEWSLKSLYIQHGRLTLSSGKISSRYGGVPLAQDIIDSVKERVIERMNQNRVEVTDTADTKQVDEDTAQKVAIAAIKYAILRVGMGKNITFDVERSLALEGDTGPYLQYTYARAQSILHKAKATVQGVPSYTRGSDAMPITNIEKLLYRFPEIMQRASEEYEPHYVAHFLAEVASTYNSWYAQEKVLDGSDAQEYKLALTKAVAITLKNGLLMLGIDTPERM